MELRPGYKQTAVGIIPEDWTVIDLPSLCLLQRGFDITAATRIPGKIPVYSSSGVSYFHNKALVAAPGVVTGRKGILGKVFLVLEPFWPHDTTLWVKDFKGNDAAYVALVLRNFHLERLDAATSVPTLNRNNLAGCLVPHPSTRAEQEAIADALGDADALLESLEQLIAKRRHLKQGTMQVLLTGRRRLPEFSQSPANYKQTEVGLIPENWEISKLGRLVKFKTGPFGSALHQSDYVDDGIPVINPMQIIDGKIVPTPSMAITEQAARKLADFRLCFGNIIIGRRGEMGRCAFVYPEQQGWLCGTGSMILRTSLSIDGRFLQRVLSSHRVIAAIESASVGSTMINLNQSTLGNLVVALPPTKAEQIAIATILSDMDAEITALEAKLAKARQIKQGMMHNLLTGKIRLV